MRQKQIVYATDALRDGRGVLLSATAAEPSKSLARSREVG
jgi:hypothetical protein